MAHVVGFLIAVAIFRFYFGLMYAPYIPRIIKRKPWLTEEQKQNRRKNFRSTTLPLIITLVAVLVFIYGGMFVQFSLEQPRQQAHSDIRGR